MCNRQLLICFFLFTLFLYFSCKEKPKVNRSSVAITDSIYIQEEDTAYILNTLQSVVEIKNPAYYDSIRKTGFDMLNKSKQMNFTRGIAESYYTLQRYYGKCIMRDSALYYGEKALKYYESLHDTFLLAHRYHQISLTYSLASRIDEAIDAAKKGRYYYECVGDTFKIFICTYYLYYFQDQLQHSEKKEFYLKEMAELAKLSGNKKIEAHFNHMQAGYFVDNANIKPAMDLYFKNIILSEEIGDTNRLAEAYGGIANIYFILNDFEAALEYYFLAEKMYFSLENIPRIGRLYNYLGQCYIALEEIDKAREYLRKSLDIRRKMKYDLETAEILHTLALSYYKTEDSLDLALNYLAESLELNRRIKNNEGIAENLILQGKIEDLKGRKNRAIQMVEKGLSIAKEYNIPELIAEGSSILSDWYAERGLYKQAYNYNKQFNELNDSLLSGENYRKTTQLEMQYKFDKEQNAAELKHIQEKIQIEAELKRNKLVRNYSILVGILLVALGTYAYRSYLLSRKANKEKEALLKEIHHRVKNNLQVISSLLNLQSGKINDVSTKAAVTESQSRVKSMALIHQLLYQSELFTSIDFSKYLEQLMASLQSSYSRPGENVKFRIESDPIKLDIDTAIPLGLIVNELATNAYKYAFKGKDEGQINISFTKTPDRKLLFTLADNGVGFPADFDIENSSSLGLKLVRLLARQLKAKLEYELRKGAVFKIYIPEAA